jgi:hypothetical protein
MAKSITVTLVDDIDGGDAVETVNFSFDGKSYEIDLNKKNGDAIRAALKPFIASSRVVGKARSGEARSFGSANKTLFSQLDGEEKARFRKWAKAPNARRIADSKVNEWVKAGKP